MGLLNEMFGNVSFALSHISHEEFAPRPILGCRLVFLDVVIPIDWDHMVGRQTIWFRFVYSHSKLIALYRY